MGTDFTRTLTDLPPKRGTRTPVGMRTFVPGRATPRAHRFFTETAARNHTKATPGGASADDPT